jgi:hypothetical protein
MSDSEILAGAALGDIGQLLNASADECGRRGAIVPSPGTRTNFVVLRDGPKAADGLGRVRNVGRCDLFIDALDLSGNVLRGDKLRPGEVLLRFGPTSGAQRIVAVCRDDCFEHSEIEWDCCPGIV